MKALRTIVAAGMLHLTVATSAAWAGSREVKTVESAAEVIHALAGIPLRGIPSGLLHDAAGVAVIPHVIKTAFVLDAHFGRGVIVVHEPDGRWGNPVFITLTGGGAGAQAGIELTDLVLVFKTRKSLDRALQGRLTLGEDVTVAAGPLGRDAEAATDRRLLKAEIYSYSRSRGLFAGMSREGARLHMDTRANEVFYGLRDGRPEGVFGYRGAPLAVAETLKARIAELSGMPPPVVVPVPVGPPHPVRP
jgi:lipid-binding SYLF domain-containing protein